MCIFKVLSYGFNITNKEISRGNKSKCDFYFYALSFLYFALKKKKSFKIYMTSDWGYIKNMPQKMQNICTAENLKCFHFAIIEVIFDT